MKNKKSQIEIMGLMVVVILLIVGVLFAVKFVVLKKPPEVKQTYSATQTASNMGLAIMSSTTENCRGTTLKDLMVDCAESPESEGTITCDNGKKSCKYLNETLSEIFNKTLNAWNRKYYVTIGTSKKIDEQIVYINNKDCMAEKTMPGESESFFVQTSRGLLTLKIFICQ